MARKAKTGFDGYFDGRMKEPAFAAEYAGSRAEIDAIDALIRALDHAREHSGLTEAELARRISAKPEMVLLLALTDGSSSEEEIRLWLHSPNRALGDKSPIDLIKARNLAPLRRALMDAITAAHGG